ncbi:MAG: hypothetical protein FWC68_03515, partial [Oscillospiraceae bacterium]|nr:hypothetical protein [Oscillospiraceae bacterium]
YDKLVGVIESYKNGIDVDENNIYLDKDYLISSGTENTQNTWMDAKYSGISITPRNGKAVEINAMWYNSLKLLEKLSIKFDKKDDAKTYNELAKKSKKSFEKEFYCEKRKSLYDVIRRQQNTSKSIICTSIDISCIRPRFRNGRTSCCNSRKKAFE